MPNTPFSIVGKPDPKYRRKLWTPENSFEEHVVSEMAKKKVSYAGCDNAALSIWVYGANPNHELVALWDLYAGAAVHAGVIDSKQAIVHGAFERRRVDDESNPSGVPGATVRVGNWT